MLLLHNMEFLHREYVLLAITKAVHYIQIYAFGLASSDHFVFVHVEDDGVSLHQH